MNVEFAVELASEIRENPGLRAYDYAMRLSDRGVACTENRVNRALEQKAFSKMIRSGMVATHCYETMSHPRWFTDLPARVRKHVPKVKIEERFIEERSFDDETNFLLRQISGRGKSSVGHFKRMVATRILIEKLSKVAS